MKSQHVGVPLILLPLFLLACGAPDPCTVGTNEDGQPVLTCPDGTQTVLPVAQNGAPGEDGAKGSDGAPGTDGPNGKNSLLRLETTTPGEYCPGRGEAIHAGLDANGNDKLDDEEITATSYVCAPCLQIEGDLEFTSPADFEPFQGECLEVFGNLDIKHFEGTSLAGIPAIVHVSGRIHIKENDDLESVEGLEHLNFVGNSLDISENKSLKTIGDFPSLERVVSQSLILRDNAALTAIGHFPSLTFIGNGLFIEDNKALKAIDSFPALEEVGEYLSIYGNEALESIEGFTALEEAGQSISISRNKTLKTIGEFPALTFVGDFYIAFNDALTSTPDFPALEAVEYGINISRNDALTSIGDFPALKEVGGGLAFEENSALTQIPDFPALTSVGGFYIALNDALTSIGEFPALETVDDGFYIEDNEKLTSLGNFSALKSIDDSLYIGYNDVLESLGDFSALETVDGEFEITNNPKLSICLAQALADQVEYVGAVLTGNDETVSCSS